MERRENTEAREEEKGWISREGRKRSKRRGERWDIKRRESTKARNEEKCGISKEKRIRSYRDEEKGCISREGRIRKLETRRKVGWREGS